MAGHAWPWSRPPTHLGNCSCERSCVTTPSVGSGMVPAPFWRLSTMDETEREQIALFRYGVISELVSRPLAPREKEKLLAAIAAKTWVVPGSRRTQIGRTTVRDWIELYQRQGFDGLKPAQPAP